MVQVARWKFIEMGDVCTCTEKISNVCVYVLASCTFMLYIDCPDCMDLSVLVVVNHPS